MLRKIRLTFAMICFALITLLFLDLRADLEASAHGDVPFLRFSGDVVLAVRESEHAGERLLLHAVHHVLAEVLLGGKQ